MASTAKERVQAFSQQFAKSTDTFEGIPRISTVAGDSTDQRLKGKVVIVTGVDSPIGIGRASAHQFARNGAKAVFICDYSTQYLETHRRELNELYPKVDVHARKVDAGEEKDVVAVVDEALEKYGRLDVFFANAGIRGSPQGSLDIDPDDFMQVMKTNALGVFLAAKYGSQAMRRTSKDKPDPGGSIIGTASVAGIRANAGGTDYSASKAAVISIMQTSAYALYGTGIRCNAICPGVIETGMTKPMYDMARDRGTVSRIGQINPLQRGAAPDEVARVALFLASDEASYVNGQAWPVDGGLSAGHPHVVRAR